MVFTVRHLDNKHNTRNIRIANTAPCLLDAIYRSKGIVLILA